MKIEVLLVVSTFFGALCALVYALLTAKRVLKFSEGNDLMKKISAAIRKGANAYLKRQYRVVIIFFAIMFVVFYNHDIAAYCLACGLALVVFIAHRENIKRLFAGTERKTYFFGKGKKEKED